ncbi:hypothetical protein JCM3774_000593 [Rhodotorula dairenensis]
MASDLTTGAKSGLPLGTPTAAAEQTAPANSSGCMSLPHPRAQDPPQSAEAGPADPVPPDFPPQARYSPSIRRSTSDAVPILPSAPRPSNPTQLLSGRVAGGLAVPSTTDAAALDAILIEFYAPARDIFPLVKPSSKTVQRGPRQQQAADYAPLSPITPPSTPPFSTRTSSDPSSSGSVARSRRGGSTLDTDEPLLGSPRGGAGVFWTSAHSGTYQPRQTSLSASSPPSSSIAPPVVPPSAMAPPKRAKAARPDDAASLAPTHARKYCAASPPDLAPGPSGSTVQDPAPTPRSLRKLLSREKLSAFFAPSRGKSGVKSGAEGITPSGLGSMSDAARATSSTWAHRRGHMPATGQLPAPSVFSVSGAAEAGDAPKRAAQASKNVVVVVEGSAMARSTTRPPVSDEPP